MNRFLFYDGEYCTLSTNVSKILSIGFVTDDCNKLYLEYDYCLDDCDQWVRDNVLPHRTLHETVDYNQGKTKIFDFIKNQYGKEKPILVSDVISYGWIVLTDMFGIFNMPVNYIPIDLATILFMSGIDPDINREWLGEKTGYDLTKHKKHNALDDAMLVRHLFYHLKK